jgi:hypothetical protein
VRGQPDQVNERHGHGDKHPLEDPDPDHARCSHQGEPELIWVNPGQPPECLAIEQVYRRRQQDCAKRSFGQEIPSSLVSSVTTTAIVAAATRPTSADRPPDAIATAVRESAPVTANPGTAPRRRPLPRSRQARGSGYCSTVRWPNAR